jgi:hypothetical protein
MEQDEVEQNLDFLIERILPILEYVGLPIDKQLEHYYDVGEIDAGPLRVALKDIFLFIDEDLLDNT